jgi:hypothetical protein
MNISILLLPSSLQISSYFFWNGSGLKELNERLGRFESFFWDEAWTLHLI